jgi:hypothetical protein
MRRKPNDLEIKELAEKERHWYLKSGSFFEKDSPNPEWETLMVTEKGVWSLQEVFEILNKMEN